MPNNAVVSARLPFEVHREMVDSLFGRGKVIALGLVAHVTCVVACWVETDDLIYLAWVPYFVSVVIFRYITFIAYGQARAELDSDQALDGWEWRYSLGGLAVAFGVGCISAYAVFTAPHTLAPAIGMSLVGGTMISVVARNFGSLLNAKLMTYACCIPLLIGFLLAGWLQENYLVALAILPIYVIVSTSIDLAGYLHGLLVGALRSGRQSDIASQKFNVAIASMPNGLVMVDGNWLMIVVNVQAVGMLGLGSAVGMDLPSALRLYMVDPEAVLEAITNGRSRLDDEEMTFETADGRWLQFRVNDLDIADKRYMDEEWGGKQEGAFVLTILDVSRRVVAEREMEHLARFDGLTQLANRRYWEEGTQAAVARLPAGSLVGLAVLDVDRFKLINDTLGHHIGDEVIRGVADRIRSVGDQRMFAGRLGGDEFVVLFPGVKSIDDARQFYDRIFRAISTTYVIDNHNVEVRCSGGVIIRSKEEFNLHADMSRADMVLYKVKRNHNQAWMLFNECLEEEYQSSIRIKHDLRDAIERGSLEVVYQPIFDAKGERIVAAEALCRWEHYEAGHIPPAQFIAMAEEIGVIGNLTEYVLRSACRDCMSWKSDVSVAVNLSAIDLAKDGIVEIISNALAEHRMPATRLCIEVTETVFVKDFEKTALTLSILRGMGVKTSLDDFGTGYSSLSYMHRLPLNRVKIDRSFVVSIVNDVKSEQLFKAVVGLANGLGYEVVVEGVETREQLERVVAVPGVDMIQGYIFAKGLTKDEMSVMTEERMPLAGRQDYPAG